MFRALLMKAKTVMGHRPENTAEVMVMGEDDDDDMEMDGLTARDTQTVTSIIPSELVNMSFGGVHNFNQNGIFLRNENGNVDDYSDEMVSQENVLIETFEDGECSFCGVPVAAKKGIMLESCCHPFCRECLTATIETQDAAEIKCPLSYNTGGCQGFISQREIRALLSPESYNMFIERSMKLARKTMNIFYCKRPNCEGWCDFEEGRKTFECYLCSSTNCLDCEAVHEGVECSVYKNFLAQGKTHAEIQSILESKGLSVKGWSQLKSLVGDVGNKAGDSSKATSSLIRRLAEVPVFQNTSPFECPICMSRIEVAEGVILQECLHTFCRMCLSGLIQHCDEPQIKCPYIDGNYSCVGLLMPREIRQLVSQEAYEKHELKSLKIAEGAMTNSFHCKTPDCPGWVELGHKVTKFNCVICKASNCVKCKRCASDLYLRGLITQDLKIPSNFFNNISSPVPGEYVLSPEKNSRSSYAYKGAIHSGTCKDYKNSQKQNANDLLSEKALEEMVKNGECMRCPKCQSWVQKIAGCDWLICTRCKTELCWATKGPRWGPKGKGDTSGGCKCDYPARKLCHPKCRNCH